MHQLFFSFLRSDVEIYEVIIMALEVGNKGQNVLLDIIANCSKGGWWLVTVF